jgi:4-hydroxy-2-oxoheptanedioate aldolase
MYGSSCLVRVPVCADWMISQALDQGAEGIIVPHIEEKESAEAFVSMTKFPPSGIRGYTPFSKAGGFCKEASFDYARRANESVVTGIIIESKKGFDCLDDILEVKDLDIVYFGAYDLSAAFGRPGDVYDPIVVDKISKGIQKVIKSGKIPGAFVAQSMEDVKRYLKMGIRFITYDVDCNMIYKTAKEINDNFRGEV